MTAKQNKAKEDKAPEVPPADAPDQAPEKQDEKVPTVSSVIEKMDRSLGDLADVAGDLREAVADSNSAQQLGLAISHIESARMRIGKVS